MYKALINFIYWLLIKSAQTENGSSLLEVDSAANKIVLLNFQGSVRYELNNYLFASNAFTRVACLMYDFYREI